MSAPKLYSVTAIPSTAAARDSNGVYFLRSPTGFTLHRVDETAGKNVVDLEVTINRKDTYRIFGADTTTGVLDWSDVSNTKPGSTPVLLYGSDANGPGGNHYYHVFNFEYYSKDGTGNLTQLAIPYFVSQGSMRYRTRYNGTWSAWVMIYDTNNLVNVSQLTNDLSYLKMGSNPGTPLNPGFNIELGSNSGATYIQSHNSQILNLNPLGNEVKIAGNTVWHSGNDVLFHKINPSGALNNASDSNRNKSWFDYNYAGTGLWGSVISFSGLGADYQTELFGQYSNGGNNFYLRTRNGDALLWNSPKRIWTNGDFSQTDINKGITAHGWGDHAGLYLTNQFGSALSQDFRIKGRGKIVTRSNTNIGLEIEASSGQSVNLQEWQAPGGDAYSFVTHDGKANFNTDDYVSGDYDVLVKNQTTGLQEKVPVADMISGNVILNGTASQGANFNISGTARSSSVVASDHWVVQNGKLAFEDATGAFANMLEVITGTGNFKFSSDRGGSNSFTLDQQGLTDDRSLVIPDADGHLPVSDSGLQFVGVETGSDTNPYMHIVHDGNDLWLPLLTALP